MLLRVVQKLLTKTFIINQDNYKIYPNLIFFLGLARRKQKKVQLSQILLKSKKKNHPKMIKTAGKILVS